MTNAQATKLGKELLTNLPGFVVGKKMVFRSPADDFLRALYFENTSDADCFHLWVFFLPFFPACDDVSFNFGYRIGDALNWCLDNPNLLADLRTTISTEAIPFLNKVSTTAGIIDYFRSEINANTPRVDPHTLEALAYTLIKTGDYSAALKTLEEFKPRFGKSTTPWVLELVARAESTKEKLLSKPETALAQLEAWKRETITNLGLEKHVVSE